jgi:hypothetical protein
MTSDPFDTQTSGPGAAVPPVTSGDFQTLEPPRSWPTVIGVFGIIFASLAILGGICGVISPFMGSFFSGMVPEEQRDQMVAQMRLSAPYPLLQAGYQLVELVISIVLLVGSISLLRRSPGAPKLLRGYAWSDLVANLLGAGLTTLIGLSQIEQIKADPSLAGMAGPLAGQGMIVFGIVMFLLAGIWPVFLLLWFARSKVKEHVAGWGDTSLNATI